MATIKFYDEAGATTRFELIGETGLVNSQNLIANYSSYTSVLTQNSSTAVESLYTGNTLAYVLEWDYTNVTSPVPDKSKLTSLSATINIASSRRKARSVRQSLANSTAALVSFP